jgi:hypothetical protein
MEKRDYKGNILKDFYWKRFDKNVQVKFNDTKESLSECQQQTFSQLENRLNLIHETIVLKIFEFYAEAYSDYISGIEADGYDPLSEVVQETIPKPSTPEALRNNYFPLSIYIPNVKDCVPGYFGVYFDCTWDINNSLGIIIRDWQVFLVGNGDRAFLF